MRGTGAKGRRGRQREGLTGPALRARLRELIRSPGFDPDTATVMGVLPRAAVAPLLSFLCSGDPEVKWGAVRALGALAARLADEDLEAGRDVVRRLMWSLNHESGAVGWGAPEAMGEVLARHEGLAREFAPILVSYLREEGNLLEFPPLQRGALWAVGRLARERPALLKALGAQEILDRYGTCGDPEARNLARRAAALLHAGETG